MFTGAVPGDGGGRLIHVDIRGIICIKPFSIMHTGLICIVMSRVNL